MPKQLTRSSVHYSPPRGRARGHTAGAVLALENYFGDGSDGDLSTSGNVTLTVTQDAGPVIKNYKNLTINAGHILTVNNRCKGLYIYVDGDLTISGTVSMTKKGASGTPVDVVISKWVPSSEAYWLDNFLSSENNNQVGLSSWAIPLYGGRGADSVLANGTGGSTAGVTGEAGINRGCGGGGSGAAKYSTTGGTGTSGRGGRGTAFGGGPGGGGITSGSQGAKAGDGSDSGGVGGAAVAANISNTGAGGGAGNLGGAGAVVTTGSGSNGEDGTGGVLVFIVRGNVLINSGGVIECDGAAGGAATNCGGGGSGGGSQGILYGGSYTNSGTRRANGGAGGVGGTQNGGAGGAGSVWQAQIIN